jgi:ketosteroid isomerase-like protein
MTLTTFDYETAATDFYRELDANDQGVFQRRLAPDAVFTFNDVDPVVGNDAIGRFIGDWKSNFKSLTHEIHQIIVDPLKRTAGIEVTVTYAFPDGKVVNLQGCSFLDFADERITGYRVYVDTSRLS